MSRIIKQTKEQLKIQFDLEMDVITRHNFMSYFAVLVNIMHHGIEKGVLMISRGSASGSYVWYLLGGSLLHPLEHGLMFERFLAEMRLETGELPDIDIDIAASKRHIIQDYARERWGFEPVGTVLTYSHKSLVRVIERIYRTGTKIRLSKALVDGAANADPDKREENKAFVEFMDTVGIWSRSLYDSMNGTKSGYGTHACAVVPLNSDIPVPIEHFTNQPVVAYNEAGNNKTLQHLGMVKYDFLSSDALDILQILKDKLVLLGVTIPDVIEDDDPCFEIFNKQNVSGIFQFDTNVARLILNLMDENGRVINSIHILADLTSLGRPGPLQNNDHITYAQDNADLSHHPDFIRNIFADTGGVLIYQEQVAQLFSRIAFQEYDSYALQYGIVALKALVPKNQKVAATKEFQDKYQELHTMFINGGKTLHGLDEEYLEELFNSLVGFIRYGFNLSHALSYANESAKHAWCKFNYPNVYWSTILSKVKNDANDRGKLLRYLIDATISSGMTILPPHINTADYGYTLLDDGKTIQCPISMVQGLGDTKNILGTRKDDGDFISLKDLAERVPTLKRNIKKRLYDAGMLDGLPGDLHDLGVLVTKFFTVPKAWDGCTNEGVVTKIESDKITLDTGVTLQIPITPSEELIAFGKTLKIKPNPNTQHLLVNTKIFYYELDGVLLSFKRIVYHEPNTNSISKIQGIKNALGFALPENLAEMYEVVRERKDLVLGFVTEIDEKHTDYTEQIRLFFHTGQRAWFCVEDRTKTRFILEQTNVKDIDTIRAINVGDLVCVKLAMTEDDDGNPMTYNLIQSVKVMA